MSTDRRITKDLMQTLEDGRKGYAQAADKLAGERPTVAAKMRAYSAQRAQFSAELDRLARAYGDDIDEDGSMAGTVHRGWIAVKDALTGDNPEAILNAVETGENHAVAEFAKALDEDISPNLRTVIHRQFVDVQAARADIQALVPALN